MKNINKVLLLFFIIIIFVGIIICIALLNTSPTPTAQQEFYCGNAIHQAASKSVHEAGEKLFKENCKSCHKVHEDVVGPALYGVTKIRPKEWIYAFIQNSSDLIAKKDTMAINVFNKYNNAIMPSFPSLTEGEIDSILIYIEEFPDMQSSSAGLVVD